MQRFEGIIHLAGTLHANDQRGYCRVGRRELQSGRAQGDVVPLAHGLDLPHTGQDRRCR